MNKLYSLLGGVIPVLIVVFVAQPAEPLGSRSLSDQVVIRRDTYGVPHILAETEEAAAFAMGYAQAEDHCVEIARRFVAARGESAKHLGAGVEEDFRMKRYGNYEVAKTNFHKLGPLFQRMMTAYAQGFNLYVSERRRELPDWIPAFDGVDVLARGRAEVMRFAFRESTIAAVRAKYPEGAATGRIESPLDRPEIAGFDQSLRHIINEPALQSETDLLGSNMWALAGSRTTTGNAILLGNPHQPWAALYWEAHITVPGKINFFGGTCSWSPQSHCVILQIENDQYRRCAELS
jgi:acyl-homoserine lactone acylase PvdQ